MAAQTGQSLFPYGLSSEDQQKFKMNDEVRVVKSLDQEGSSTPVTFGTVVERSYREVPYHYLVWFEDLDSPSEAWGIKEEELEFVSGV